MAKHTMDHGEFTMQRKMQRAFAMLLGKLKLEIMRLLYQRTLRFGELRKRIPGITQHMLTAQLRELEADGLVLRTVFAEMPPRVEYQMTAKALGLTPTMEALTVWWNDWGKESPPKTTLEVGSRIAAYPDPITRSLALGQLYRLATMLRRTSNEGRFRLTILETS